MSLEYSPLESSRFNLRILRGSFTKLEPYEVLRTIVEEKADVAIFRLPTSQQHQLHQLSMLPFPVVVADTLVSFDGDLREYPAQPLRNTRLEIHRATFADTEVLDELINLSFKDYRSHYNSNPLFDPELVLAGYKEWALSCLEPSDERICFLFYLDGQAVAYTTNQVHSTYGEGIIFGARPNIAAKNIYVDLLNHTKQYMWDRGLKKVRATTQIQNHGVQRAWARMGLFPSRSYVTVHINALLQKQTSSVSVPTIQPSSLPDSGVS
ncbi:hypothetical protein SAMN02745146_2411 [Hymenobacter daecheongensis DSM 21074]|uniref:N-acetyltransferase domain-containing protein n=1 Tax=Hymenobacter daecheongensis DSM 21074 TaxID=1121955 RepID=A0A1M6GVL7_9BACT|nr:GNAT family N-acetyltransferase [Hymenobacter daecheongensis]SHJ13989.1 hypothetical protein SAMN02745146_2411 [Hymenobacter daecheongensis DSM 21074]